MTPDLPQKLDELTPQQLIAEIAQISQQYAAEVPGTRRNWPESIRARVLALRRLGVGKKRIADLSRIPSSTVFLWCRRSGGSPSVVAKAPGFVELKPRLSPPDRIPTVAMDGVVPTVGTPTVGIAVGPNWRMRTPAGFEFEGPAGATSAWADLYRELTR